MSDFMMAQKEEDFAVAGNKTAGNVMLISGQGRNLICFQRSQKILSPS
jgi:hypothetical protein